MYSVMKSKLNVTNRYNLKYEKVLDIIIVKHMGLAHTLQCKFLRNWANAFISSSLFSPITYYPLDASYCPKKFTTGSLSLDTKCPSDILITSISPTLGFLSFSFVQMFLYVYNLNIYTVYII